MDGLVVRAALVPRDLDVAREVRGRERRVEAAVEIEGGAPVREAVRLEPRDPRRVARVRVDLVLAALAEPGDERPEGRRGVVAGVREQDRAPAVGGRRVAGHATVALEDHTGQEGVDDLAGLLLGDRGSAGPGRVLRQRQRDEGGAVGGRDGAEHRAQPSRQRKNVTRLPSASSVANSRVPKSVVVTPDRETSCSTSASRSSA